MTASEPRITKKIKTNDYEIQLLDSGIIEINWSHDINEITAELLKELKDIIFEFGQGKRMRVFVSTINFMSINTDARKYAASKTGQEFTLANAVLVDNLGKNILYNFYVKLNKPSTPTRAFRSREEAFQWLLKLPD